MHIVNIFSLPVLTLVSAWLAFVNNLVWKTVGMHMGISHVTLAAVSIAQAISRTLSSSSSPPFSGLFLFASSYSFRVWLALPSCQFIMINCVIRSDRRSERAAFLDVELVTSASDKNDCLKSHRHSVVALRKCMPCQKTRFNQKMAFFPN